MNKLFVLILLVVYLFVGCNNNHDNDNENEHNHNKENEEYNHSESDKPEGLESLSYTIYTDKTELFVEFSPLIVGETTTFITHLTKLETFKPITEGNLTISLKGKIDQFVEVKNPSSPGIFRPSLQPKQTGTYQLVFEVSTNEYSDKIIIDNIVVYPDKETAIKNQIAQPESEGITYLKEQAWKIDFANIEVKKQPFYEIIKTTGEILPAQGDEIVITAKTNGIVFFSNNTILAGTKVNIGTSLFSISGSDLVENNLAVKFQQAKSIYEKTKTDFERAKVLVENKIISEKEFLEIKLNFENAETTYNTLAKNYSNGGDRITAPITGFIKNVYVNEGQYVEMGQPIASIAKNKRLIIKAEVSQKHFSKLPEIYSANFITPYDNKTYDIEDLNGKLISYGKNTDNSSFYTPVYFEIDNKGEIIPGSFIEIFLKANVIPDALIVPYSALIEEQGNYYVYVQISGETFEKREVKLGANDGINVQILSGIKENERVVTIGAYRIKLATMSSALPDSHAGHAH